jgi:hypothetical protein
MAGPRTATIGPGKDDAAVRWRLGLRPGRPEIVVDPGFVVDPVHDVIIPN